MKILLVEDDEGLLEILKEILTSQHYLVECATDGLTGWELAETFDYDLILLDWMVPKLDGISFCQRLRAQTNASALAGFVHRNHNTPIILLTAKDSGAQRVLALDTGADDYLVKPIDPQELLARIRALWRRGGGARSPILVWGNLTLNPDSCEVSCQNHRLSLTAKEYEVVELLMRNPQRIFSQRYLLEHLWQTEDMPTENTVRSHIKSMRQKLKKAGAGDVIETVYGLGYRLRGMEEIVEPQVGEEERKMGKIGQTGEIGAIGKGLEAIWEKYRGQYGDRLQVIQAAIVALAQGNLDPALQQRARQEAHTLIGSLGSFNLHQAAQLARELEQHFKSPSLDATQAQALSALATTLNQLIQQVSTSRHEAGSPRHKESLEAHGPQSVRHKVGGRIQNSKFKIHTSKEAIRNLTGGIQDPKLELRVLIVEDDLALATAIQTEAARWGMQTAIAISPAAARAEMAASLPSGIVLDLTFPEADQGGLELLREWSKHYPAIPVIVFTAQEGLEERLAVAQSGARMFLQKPIAARDVVSAIAQILQSVAPLTAKLLVVDDDPAMLEFLQPLLHPWGFEITFLSDPQQFWPVLEQTQPDLLILDIEMPDASGIDLCQVVRNDARWGDIPILILSVHQDAETITRVFTAGADDYISKPIVGPELMARIINRLNRIHKMPSLITLKTVP